MKIKFAALLALASFNASAAYVQAHDPHVVAPYSLNCSVTFPEPEITVTDTGNYYAGTEGLKGDALKRKLNQIISVGHKKLPYTNNAPGAMDVWKALMITDEDPSNPDNVLLMYTGRSQAKGSRTGQTYPGIANQDTWNREHVYPKSNGGFNDKSAYAYTDIHHLRATDSSINAERGNLEFDWAEKSGQATKDTPEAGNKLVAKSHFEPRDVVKGDVARMIFYMAIRYEGADPKTPDLELVKEVVNNGTAFGNVCTLLQWNQTDPVDQVEANRNDKIHTIQGNRNPFIDNPEWADEIFAKDCK